MARNRVDACMFCEQAPCECNKKPKAAAPRAAKPKPAKAVQITAPTVPAPRVAPVVPKVVMPKIIAAKPIKTSRANLSSVKTINQSDDQEFRAALTALSSLLHRDELELHRSSIDLPPHKIDALIWRQDHGR